MRAHNLAICLRFAELDAAVYAPVHMVLNLILQLLPTLSCTADNVLNSERCLAELEAAARHSVHVVLIVKEGARWGDSSGRLVSYPPPETIRTLKPAVQTIFAHKAVHHRCV